MKRLFPLVLLASALPVAAQDIRPAITPIGNPSALIAAESAFARLAREKGQWTAFAETATDEAEMFVPQRTPAKAWLKGRANPPQAVQWQPSSVWMSCDGSAGVTFGGYQAGAGYGWFSTVWERQKKKGDYKWVLDQGGDLAAPLAGAGIEEKRDALLGRLRAIVRDGSKPLPVREAELAAILEAIKRQVANKNLP